MPDTTIVGRHVKRGADERPQRSPWSRYIGLHEDNDASRAKRYVHYRRRRRAER